MFAQPEPKRRASEAFMALSASGAQTQAHSAPEASVQLGGVSEPQHHAPQPAPSAEAPVPPAQAERSAGGTDPAAMPAMFWDTLPEGESQHPDKLAMDAMMEELTPAERAANLKVRGNDAFKRGVQLRKKFYLREAADLYTQGLAASSGDAVLDAVLYANRAEVHLQLGNNRNALEDSQAAVSRDSTATKAYYRGARAALRLRQWDTAQRLCTAALGATPDAQELAALLKEAEDGAAQDAERQAREREAAAAAREPARRLAELLTRRGWRIGLPQVTIGSRKPVLDAEGHVQWPVLFIYPQSMETDAVEAFHELHAFADHLDVMFGPEAPPLPWDTEHAYRRDTVELWYLSHAARPLDVDHLTETLYGGWPAEVAADEGPQRYGKDRAGWIRISEDRTLADILGQPDYVVPGIPVFFVTATGTTYRERFLQEAI